jgi:hypothetical protein
VASSDVEICNIALKRLGCALIVSLTDGSDQASALSAVYNSTRDRLLRELPWNFAQFRVRLASDPTKTPVFGYAYAYPLPTMPYCVKVNETDPPDAVFDIENTIDSAGKITGRVLVTDESQISIRYTGQVTDPQQFDASFVEAFASDLAAQVAYPLTESEAKTKSAAAWADAALKHAQTVNGQEGSTRQADINILVDVRRHGFIEDFSRNQNSI